MDTFEVAMAGLERLDPFKRVNYTFGLVLGVDEFVQEQTYFGEKHRRHYRMHHGFGTACGLEVTIVEEPVRVVRVSPGTAVNPAGQEIHVPRAMCCRIDEWLDRHRNALSGLFETAPAELPLCVVLCYRESKTDVVPVPGEPCRSQEDALAPSRVAECFELLLCLSEDAFESPPLSPPSDSSAMCTFAPMQAEEEALRRFGDILAGLHISPMPTGMPPVVFNAYIIQQRNAVRAIAGLPPVADVPAGPPGKFQANPAQGEKILRALFRTWVVEVLPHLNAGEPGCDPPRNSCVLLAELGVPINEHWRATAAAVRVDETRRPCILPLVALQEAVLAARAPGDRKRAEGAIAAGAAYLPVAAGSFRADGTAIGPVLGRLRVTREARRGDYLLEFAGYEKPAAREARTYLVRTTAYGNATFRPPEFEDRGIRLTMQGRAAVDFAVEIAQIGGSE